jgi:hypothetical protein
MLYWSLSIRMGSAGHVSSVKTRSPCKHSVGKFLRNRSGGIFSCKWENIIKVGVIEMRCEVADWIQVEHDGVYLQALVNTVNGPSRSVEVGE